MTRCNIPVTDLFILAGRLRSGISMYEDAGGMQLYNGVLSTLFSRPREDLAGRAVKFRENPEPRLVLESSVTCGECPSSFIILQMQASDMGHLQSV